MTDNQVPDTEQVRHVWVDTMVRFELSKSDAVFEEWDARFNAWLDRVKADAIREARDSIMPPYNIELRPDGSEDPHVAEYVRIMDEVQDRLSLCANRVEAMQYSPIPCDPATGNDPDM